MFLVVHGTWVSWAKIACPSCARCGHRLYGAPPIPLENRRTWPRIAVVSRGCAVVFYGLLWSCFPLGANDFVSSFCCNRNPRHKRAWSSISGIATRAAQPERPRTARPEVTKGCFIFPVTSSTTRTVSYVRFSRGWLSLVLFPHLIYPSRPHLLFFSRSQYFPFLY